MGALKNIVEPGAIVALFTLGSWINRKKKSLDGYGETRSLLRVDNPEERDISSHAEARHARNREYIHSRVLERFPFLLEIWYWLLIYWIYQGCRAISARLISGNEAIFQNAERHAIQILTLENRLSIDVELSVQQFVLSQCPWMMDILADIYYSHIVLGVAFFVYCYTYLPSGRYQIIRRTLALENVIAFVILSLWRCKPPRLLPEEFGFVDVLHRGNSGSAWTQNKFQLTIAAMPSLHFGNSVLIAFCLVMYSPHVFLRCVAVLWPVMMGVTVVATANHFILDAVVGVTVIILAFRFNGAMLILLPVERGLLRLLRLEKPQGEHTS
ncbi:hypothetical protein N7494_009892 [Penicillium frequentans]|uniref:Inositolphosphotransferase Aur1/Ipt1 domain-containing protein n=1 Tax=Penicillium frequentans TaxID=3151616 RepID=A0AAD6CR63_9EURO|nr:hypothetical protein N7494_009892 [Penicillium glabrum]